LTGIGDPIVEGWPTETAPPPPEDEEPPPPPPHSPSASEASSEEEEDDDAGREDSDGDGSGSLVVVSREDIAALGSPTAAAAAAAATGSAALPFPQKPGPPQAVPLRQHQAQPLPSLLEAQDWGHDSGRNLARGRCDHMICPASSFDCSDSDETFAHHLLLSESLAG
jgi:hypothetical protein